MNKTLPYLVSNVIELLDVDPEELGVEEDGGHVDLDSQRKGKLKLGIWENGFLTERHLNQAVSFIINLFAIIFHK